MDFKISHKHYRKYKTCNNILFSLTLNYNLLIFSQILKKKTLIRTRLSTIILKYTICGKKL